ncbi:MAG: DbpA RNA binding domain-containing protein [Gemmatimonadales bacterium]
MESFDEIDVAPELVEALAADGIERPTPLQEATIPLLRRGNNLVIAAGPGSGLLVGWIVPLLERIDGVDTDVETDVEADVEADIDTEAGAEPEADGEVAAAGEDAGAGPSACVLALVASREAADQLAECSARLAASLGHAVAAIGAPWALPERARVVFGTPADVLAQVASGALDLSGVRALVVDQAQQLERLGTLGDVERVIDYIPADAQRVVSALPVTGAVADFVERHCKRAVTWPATSAASAARAPSMRGSVRFRVTSEDKEDTALQLADELLTGGGARHVLFYCRSDDDAADLGDFLTLHGYVSGAPGDTSVPVWLGVDALEGRSAAKGIEDVRAVSYDVPTDADMLDRRHGFSADGVVMVLGREVSHLRSMTQAIGYEPVPFPAPARRKPGALEHLRASLERALESEAGAPYFTMLEPLFRRFDPTEVAAAAVALLRETKPAAAAPAASRAPEAEPTSAPAWAKLFIGIGERDGLRPGDLVGAITGEASVEAHQIGKIDIRESHSVVEVHDSVARRVIKALNGTTLKGRAVRADFDRPRKGAARPPRSSRPPRPRQP